MVNKRAVILLIILLSFSGFAEEPRSVHFFSVDIGQAFSGLFLWKDQTYCLPFCYEHMVSDHVMISGVLRPVYADGPDLSCSMGVKYFRNTLSYPEVRYSSYIGLYPLYNLSIPRVLTGQGAGWNILMECGEMVFVSRRVFLDGAIGVEVDRLESFSSFHPFFLNLGLKIGLVF